MFEIYKNKKVFLTGHSGFKGGWLALWLNMLGANVCGYSLPPQFQANLYDAGCIKEHCKSVWGDILDSKTLEKKCWILSRI